jgi:hexosaminidase
LLNQLAFDTGDPLPPETNLTAEQAARVLGGEVCMWGELVTEETIDGIMWPRTAANAERFWSPQSVRDVDNMYRRLWIESIRLEQAGTTHISGPRKMQRDLAGAKPAGPLFEMASTLQPVSFHERIKAEHTNAFMSLDELTDAVVPDPPDSQHWAGREHLAEQFKIWQQLYPSLLDLVQSFPRMSDATPLAHQLPQLGTLGMAALDCLAGEQQPPAGWKQNATALLAAAERPVALVRFTFVDSLRQLVLACDSASAPTPR